MSALDANVSHVLELGRLYNPRGGLYLTCRGRRDYYASWREPTADMALDVKAEGPTMAWALRALAAKLDELTEEADADER